MTIPRATLVLVALALVAVSRPAAAIDAKCVKVKDATECDAKTTCDWCVSTSVGTGCYPNEVAKILPTKMFTCDKPPSAEPAAQAVRADGGECDKRSETDCISPDCVWCTSAAVGGGCYTPAQAKLLPSAIFKCKAAPSH